MNIKKTKEKIIESLEGKRVKQIWELIEKSYLEVYKNTKKSDLEIVKEEYSNYEDDVNDKKNRYIVVEHYNLDEGFYCRFFHKGIPNENVFEFMFENYFGDVDGSWEQILIIDMQEKKCYLVDKEVKYLKQEIEIK